MLAKRVANIPQDGGWIFEPKWDGFRAVIFRDGDEFLIQSRDGKSLNRYFPELIDPLKRELPERCILDGEIVIATGKRPGFRQPSTSHSSGSIAGKAAISADPRLCSFL